MAAKSAGSASKRPGTPKIVDKVRRFVTDRDASRLPEAAAALRVAAAMDEPHCSRLPDLAGELRQLLSQIRDLSEPTTADAVDDLKAKREQRRTGSG